ncbi:MAG: PHP domain-containing protein [Synergistaceae bacterium]|jgi:predicted metal-dependent phosphoesterase TrpH|nr:PHP domain-containing protein [Synergistaceae bacterium]
MIRIDLHVHSVFSDGTCTPAEIVREARSKGIAVLALTDHDTIEGLREFARECARLQIRPVRGVELSACDPRTIHILGYRLDREEVIEEALSWVIDRRNARNREICKKLRELGIDITIEVIESEARGRVVSRPHFASWLVKNGHVPNTKAAFDRYLARGGAAYVRRDGLSPDECVRIVRESGGLPVLAHPSLTGLEGEALDDLIADLKDSGLWGLECISSHCSAEQTYGFIAAADRHGLFTTAGSDFHGKNRPGVTLGVQVSEDFIPWARLGVTM